MPQKAFAVRKLRVEGARVLTRLRIPGRGTVDQRVFAVIDGRRRRVGKMRRKVHATGPVNLELLLDESMRKQLRQRGYELQVVTRFRPDGGLRRKVTKRVRAGKI